MTYINRYTEIFSEFTTIVEHVQLYYVLHLHMRHELQDIESGNLMISSCEVLHSL